MWWLARIAVVIFKRRIYVIALFTVFFMGLMARDLINTTRSIEIYKLGTKAPPPNEKEPLHDVKVTPNLPHNTTQAAQQVADMDLDLIYMKRRNHTKYICNLWLSSSSNAKESASKHIELLGLSFCPPGNSAMEAWRTTIEIWMRSLSSTRPSFSLDWPRYRELTRHHNKPTEDRGKARPKTATSLRTSGSSGSSLKVIYTRNPYWLLFYFFVDSFIVPSNETLQLSRNIMKVQTANLQYDTHNCGGNVPFREFILSIKEQRLFVGSTSQHCDVCGVHYDVIGKEDTLEQDTRYVYDKLKSKTRFTLYEDFHSEYEVNAVRVYVDTAYRRRHSCLPVHSVFNRLWRQLQILGYIAKALSYPFEEQASDSLDQVGLLNAVLKAYHASIPLSKRNKEEAFAQAYSALTWKELEGLRKVYLDDFFLFDYPDRPASIFFKQGPHVDFQYFDFHGITNTIKANER